jgi:3-hydroxybutyryl-CoA dehydrogenase
MNIKNVLIVGAGNMGQQIATQCAIHGFKVTLYDLEQDIIDTAWLRVERLLNSFVRSEKIGRKEADEAMGNMACTTNVHEAAERADFVSESVPEDPDLKRKVFSQINSICPSHTIFTTNTSILPLSILAEGTGRPDKFAALHFHDVRVTDIVDVMAHPGTSEETLNLVTEFATKIGQVPIVLKKESPGYVFSSMLTALFSAAQTLAANEVTSIENIDRAWMGILHVNIGPFGLMDSVGIDTVWKVTEYWAHESKDEQALKNAAFLKQYVDQGYLGQKSGRGFYTYPEPAYGKPDFIKGVIE